MFKLSLLLQEIDQFQPKLLQNINNEESIYSVHLISHISADSFCFRSHGMYVCLSSSLPNEFTFEGVFFILCILDMPISDQYKSCTDAVIITMENYNCGIDKLFDDVNNLSEKNSYLGFITNEILKDFTKYDDLEKLMNLIQNHLRNPIVYMDAMYNVISYSSKCNSTSASYESLHKLIENKFPDNSVIIKDKEFVNFKKSFGNKKPQIFNKSQEIPYRQIIGPVYVGETLTAFLTVHEIDNAFQSFDLEIVESLCYVLSLERQKAEINIHMGTERYEYIIRNILNAEEDSDNMLHALTILKLLDLNIKKYLYILTLAPPDSNEMPYSPDFICNQTRRILANAISIVYKDQIVVIITTDMELDEEYFDQIIQFAQKYKLAGGISSVFTSLNQAKRHYEQSIAALKIATDMNNMSPIAYYDKVFPYLVIQAASINDNNINTYIDPYLQKLLEYDNQHKTEYVRTLFVYLVEERNVAVASRIIHVHRNTFLYRVQKIEDIIGKSLEDPEFRFRIILSYYLLSYRYKEPSY